MTVTAWLLVALLVFTLGLVFLAAVDLVEDRRLPRRPVPLPRRRPGFALPPGTEEFSAPLLTGAARHRASTAAHRRT